MTRLPSLTGLRGALFYAVAAPLLLLGQHAVVAGMILKDDPDGLRVDRNFWLYPTRQLWSPGNVGPTEGALAIVAILALTFLVAMLSLRRAEGSAAGRTLAVLTVLPGIQYLAVAILIVLPAPRPAPLPAPAEHAPDEENPLPDGTGTRHMLQGLFAGIALIVAAVLGSALTFGAYGWGLFVMTPLMVGITTGYLANRRHALSGVHTAFLVLAAAGLGSLALVGLALEGLFCILLASPLGALFAVLGGAIGRAIGLAVLDSRRPLMSLALLPALFALEGAVPPAVAIQTDRSIDIAAPPAAVWRALTSADPIEAGPGLVGQAGLAYPLSGAIRGEGVGGERIGLFSTGTARERITAWQPARRLAFKVIDQPPAMEEMSPYRRVHAPHVQGYFETSEMSFDLQPLAGGGTRLTARAAHVLRIDPVPYWAPIARWAIGQNTDRVLGDLKVRSERR